MIARHNFGNFFQFYPVFKLSLSGNHKPEIGGVDHAIWRRMRYVVWPVTIADNERREFDDVIAELWEERAGILNWLIEGALHYLSAGLAPPQEIIDATAGYREDMDPIGGFVRDCVSMVATIDGTESAAVAAREMYLAFEAWCIANSVRSWKEKSFATAMSQKGFVKDRRNNVRRYIGVALHDVPAKPPRRDEPPHPADEEIP
jgi:putative DNA primase/helicase